MGKKDSNKQIIFEKALNTPASKLSQDVYRYQDYHRSNVHDNGFKNYFKIFEDFHEELTLSILSLNQAKKNSTWQNHNTFQALLISKIPKTLFSSFQQSISGDYDQSVATLRIAYESLLAILFIQKYPSRAADVFTDKKSGGFKASNVLTQEFPVVTEDILYTVMSYPVHLLKHRIAKEMIDSQKNGGISLSIDYDGFDKKRFGWSINLIITVIYFSLRIFNKLFSSVVDNFESAKYKPVSHFLKQAKCEQHLKTMALLLKKI